MYYSGYKNVHGFKYQSIVTPDGLVMSLIGPYEWKVNDANIFRLAGMKERFQDLFRVTNVAGAAYRTLQEYISNVSMKKALRDVSRLKPQGSKDQRCPLNGRQDPRDPVYNRAKCRSAGSR